MSLSVGIVGLPNVGKSTLFNALLGRQIADVADYPFTTIKPNVGVVQVPDERLEKLAARVSAEQKKSVKVVPAAIKFIDIAGLSKGAHRGEGLGNQFLSHIREVDVILHLIRLFKNPEVPHPLGRISPAEDKEIVEMELILKDLETVEKRLSAKPDKKSAALKAQRGIQRALKKVKVGLEQGKMIRDLPLGDEEKKAVEGLQLLTAKPTLFVLNINEGDLGALKDEAHPYSGLGKPLVPICAKLEVELSEVSAAERRAYLVELGLSSPGLDKVIKEGYKLLGFITFYTLKGGKKVQAWPLREGQTAFEAAGKVHTDFARGFIRVEVITLEKLLEAGSWQKAKEQGLIETRGRDYLVADGDVIEILHQ